MSASQIAKADKFVIPAKTGIQKARLRQSWIPAYAGMTVRTFLAPGIAKLTLASNQVTICHTGVGRCSVR